ncbi:MAG: prepilin peptidase [Paracoccaceae bacterium]
MVAFWAVTILLGLTLVAITVIDLRSYRIPDWLSLPLIAIGLAVAVWLPLLPIAHHLIGAVAGFAVFAAIGAWYHRRTGMEGLGLGDAKLFGAAGAWLGWQALPLVLLIATLGGLAYALLKGARDRRAALAFGPWLALGFWVVWLWENAGRAGF